MAQAFKVSLMKKKNLQIVWALNFDALKQKAASQLFQVTDYFCLRKQSINQLYMNVLTTGRVFDSNSIGILPF